MTRVRLRSSPGEIDLAVRGHAGRDTVCAAASMLVCALMERFERMRGDFEELHVSYSSGLAAVSARAAGETAELMNSSVETVMCGFELLGAAFPCSLTVERGGGGS